MKALATKYLKITKIMDCILLTCLSIWMAVNAWTLPIASHNCFPVLEIVLFNVTSVGFPVFRNELTKKLDMVLRKG